MSRVVRALAARRKLKAYAVTRLQVEAVRRHWAGTYDGGRVFLKGLDRGSMPVMTYIRVEG